MTDRPPHRRNAPWTARELLILKLCDKHGLRPAQAAQQLADAGFRRSVLAVTGMMEKMFVRSDDGEKPQRDDFAAQDAAFCARMEELGYRRGAPACVGPFASVPKIIPRVTHGLGSGWQFETGSGL